MSTEILPILQNIAAGYGMQDPLTRLLDEKFRSACQTANSDGKNRQAAHDLDWLLDRICPKPAEPTTPQLNLTGDSALDLFNSLMAHISAGHLTASEALKLAQTIDLKAKHSELTVLMNKLQAIEDHLLSPEPIDVPGLTVINSDS